MTEPDYTPTIESYREGLANQARYGWYTEAGQDRAVKIALGRFDRMLEAYVAEKKKEAVLEAATDFAESHRGKVWRSQVFVWLTTYGKKKWGTDD